MAVARVRRDLGLSFVSLLATDREVQGGGHNRVLGPDFEWRPTDQDTVRGQFLYGDTQNPDRPELAAEWDGRKLDSHAAFASWSHNSLDWDWSLAYLDIGNDFRADVGFLPQVGVRDGSASLGRTFRPEKGIVRRIRPFLQLRDIEAVDGSGLLLRRLVPGVELDGIWNGFLLVEHRTEKVRAGDRLFDSGYYVASLGFSPSQTIANVSLDARAGDDVDFTGRRPGTGATISLQTTLRPTDHLALTLNGSRRWLDVSPTGTGRQTLRLFTAEVARLKADYTFTSRAFLRLIGQQVKVDQDGRSETFSGSALFAYKINWQTVLFLGYGDERALSELDRLEPTGRELFLKISYAFQR